MKQFCHYHPTQTASWHCFDCDIFLCSECAIERKKLGSASGEKEHACPKCNFAVEWMGISNLIEPFWKRLPKLFIYPFSPSPLILNIILVIAATIFSGKSLFSTLTSILIWGCLIKYSYAVLTATARGNLTPPKLTQSTLSDDFGQVFKQYGLIIIIVLTITTAMQIAGPVVALPLIILAVLSLPAMIILLATTESLLHSVNPVLFINLILRIGWGYLLMYFFLTLLIGAPSALGYFVIKMLPNALHAPFICFAENFYTIVAYHLMGYVILQYHNEIGYKVEREDFHDPTAKQNKNMGGQNTSTLRRVNALITEGKLDEATAFLEQKMISENADDITLQERYFNLLKIKKQTPQLLEYGVSLLELLVQKNQRKKACMVFEECISHGNNFVPQAEILFTLGTWFNEFGNSKIAIKAYDLFTKVYSNNELVPKAYFNKAQIFHSNYSDTATAKRILADIIQKYPKNEITPHVKHYLQILE